MIKLKFSCWLIEKIILYLLPLEYRNKPYIINLIKTGYIKIDEQEIKKENI
jgi:hypothetical protein